LISSFPYAVNWSQENLPAILHMTHCSQEMGNALADVLFGNYNPAGRLVQTWPVSIDHLPDMMDYNIRNGRTYMYCKEKPLYPFGYGLSYTSFEYSNLRLSAPMLKENDEITVQVDVTNTGEVAGDEVVQLYLNYPASEVNRPQIALKGFHRVNLQPSETKTVTIPLTSELLSYWDTSSQRFKLEQGSVNILIGASSADIRLSAILKTVR
ncbi:MAG: glycoside hydrolase family 3 C-terminal domain-containing protein, partial [Bacteroidales bacterium]|nr:glycoside hydrolase family 3 C-terminal domain-containing protein [Bacteroidales bacterium]